MLVTSFPLFSKSFQNNKLPVTFNLLSAKAFNKDKYKSLSFGQDRNQTTKFWTGPNQEYKPEIYAALSTSSIG